MFAAFTLTDASLDHALFALAQAIDAGVRPPRRRPSPAAYRDRMPGRFKQIQGAIDRKISLHLDRPRVLAALNAIVTAVGEVWWKLTRGRDPTGFFRGFDGWGIDVELRNR